MIKLLQRWRSGRTRMIRNHVMGLLIQGFKSLSLRHIEDTIEIRTLKVRMTMVSSYFFHLFKRLLEVAFLIFISDYKIEKLKIGKQIKSKDYFRTPRVRLLIIRISEYC